MLKLIGTTMSQADLHDLLLLVQRWRVWTTRSLATQELEDDTRRFAARVAARLPKED